MLELKKVGQRFGPTFGFAAFVFETYDTLRLTSNVPYKYIIIMSETFDLRVDITNRTSA